MRQSKQGYLLMGYCRAICRLCDKQTCRYANWIFKKVILDKDNAGSFDDFFA